MHSPISEKEERLAKEIVDSTFTVRKALGGGLLESVYEVCFCHELRKRNIGFQRQVRQPVVYDGLQFPEGFRVDVVVEDLVICELKAVEALLPVHARQILTYLKLSQKRLGFLINFSSAYFREGIRRFIL
jgi:GxxExxY protein